MSKRLTALLLGFACASAVASQTITGTTTQTASDGKVTTTVTTSNGPAAVKAEADAASAQAGATSAQINAATAAFPGSGLAPSTGLAGSSPGYAETSLLTTVTLRAAAREITRILAQNPKALIVVGTTTTPDPTVYTLFGARVKLLKEGIAHDLGKLQDAEAKALRNKASRPKPYSAAIGVVIPLATRALSYLTTNYQVGGVNITADDYELCAALLQLDPDANLYTQVLVSGTPDAISSQIASLRAEIDGTNAAIDKANEVKADIEQDTSKPAKDDAAALASFITNLQSDVSAASAFLTPLENGTTASGTLGAITQSYFAEEAIKARGPGIAFVKVHAMAGGVITKTNLFTNLGAMPMSNSATTIVSVIYYPSGGGGRPVTEMIEIVTPYVKANHVVDVLRYDEAGTCMHPTKTQAKLCPKVYRTSSK